MNGNTIGTGWVFVAYILWLLFIIVGIRRIYIYYHPPETLGKLCCFCRFSIRKNQSIMFLIIVIVISLYKSMNLYKGGYVLIVLIIVVSLFLSFLKDRIFENGISYNHLYIHKDEINEIIYKKSRDEYLIDTKFAMQIYIKLDEGQSWPENLSYLLKSEKDA